MKTNCPMCGIEFDNKTDRLTCGYVCGQRFRYLKTLVFNDSIPINTDHCKICGASLFGRGPSRRTCRNPKCRKSYFTQKYGTLEEIKKHRLEHDRMLRKKLAPNTNARRRQRYLTDTTFRAKHIGRKHKRKALLRGVPSEPLQQLPFRSRCYWCGKKITPANMEIDHIVPLSRGGTDLQYNRVISCRNCNRSKHNKHPNNFSHNNLELCFDPYKSVTA